MKQCIRLARVLRVAALAASLTLLSCGHEAPTASSDQAMIVLQASPATLRPTTGQSVVTAYGTKKSGAAIWDGTEIFFSADLGRIDPKAVFEGGVARVTYHAPDSPGTAKVSAVCGSIEITAVPLTIEQPAVKSVTVTASRTTLPPGGGSTALRAVAYDENSMVVAGAPMIFSTSAGTLSSSGRPLTTDASGVANDRLTTKDTASVTAQSGIQASPALTITVTETTVTTLLLTATRTTLPVGGGTTGLCAIAYDKNNRAITGAPVVFTTTAGTLESGGRPLRTNASGAVRDRLTTNVDAKVTAQSGDKPSNELAITIEQNKSPTADFAFSPTQPQPKQTVYFNGALSFDEDGTIVKWQWDFGDGARATGKLASHAYAKAATYDVVLCVTDNGGAEGCTQKPVPVAIPTDSEKR